MSNIYKKSKNSEKKFSVYTHTHTRKCDGGGDENINIQKKYLTLKWLSSLFLYLTVIAITLIITKNKNCYAADYYINNLWYRIYTSYDADPSPGTDWQWQDSGSTDSAGVFSSVFGGWVNSISTTPGGGTIHILKENNNYHNIPPGGTDGNATGPDQKQYKDFNSWGTRTDNIYSNAVSFAGTQNGIIRDERGGTNTYTVSNTFTHSGSGTLTLETTGTTNFNFHGFTGSGVGGQLNVNNGIILNTGTNGYTTTLGATGTGFTANVSNNGTWNANTLRTQNNFTLQGSGTLRATSTTITGTTSSSITDFTTGGLTVGSGSTAGTLNVTAGTVTTTTADIANGSGDGTVNLSNNTTWTTSGEVNVGNSGNGKGLVTIDNSATWTASNTVNIANAANTNGEVQLKSGNWTATNQIVNVGLSGKGTVTQSGGTWANRETKVGVNSSGEGIINHTNGTHNDQKSVIGDYGKGTVNLSGTGVWNTNDNDNAGNENVAIIGNQSTGNGTVNVTGSNNNTATWTIGDNDDSDNLITGKEGTGKLEISSTTNNGAEVLVYGDHIVAQDTGSKGDDIVSGVGSKLDVKGKMVTASKGTGTTEIKDGGTANVTKDHIIAEFADSIGTDKVHGENSTLNVTENMTTGQAGKAQLKIYSGGEVTVEKNHIIAADADSYGSDQIDGNESELIVKEDMTVGQSGQAGGRYVYYERGKSGYENYPYPGGGAYNGGGDYLDPTKNSTLTSQVWLGSPNLDLRLDDTDWDKIQADAPGLAITAGGTVTVGTAPGTNPIAVNVAENDGSYAYILLDNIDNTAPNATNRSTWQIYGNLTMGVANRTNDDDDDAYMRIINGSLVDVTGNAIIASGAGTEVTVRVNGVDGAANPNEATLNVEGNLTVAKGADDDEKTEGNLYVYDKGQVIVGGPAVADMTIADEKNTLGRVHVDGDSLIDVNGLLTVANKGQAGGEYDATSANTFGNNKDKDPTNDHLLDPSSLDPEFNQWFDSDNTLSDLKDTNNINKNAPGLLITRGAKVVSNAGNVATETKSYAYIVIDGKDQNGTPSQWTVDGDGNGVDDGYLIIADKGTAYVRIFNGGLLQTTSVEDDEGNIIIANNGTADDDRAIATARVFGAGSKISASGDLIVAQGEHSDGQLYIYNGASGTVNKNMIIANAVEDNLAQVQIDGEETYLTVTQRLVVGNHGQAGGLYNENRYDVAKEDDPTILDAGYRVDPSELYHGTINNLYELQKDGNDDWWFDSPNMDLRNNLNYAGNAPGLAITDGAVVTSGSGLVAAMSGSIGYVVIDNQYGYGEPRLTSRSTWHVIKTVDNTKLENGDLVIGREGTGFVRVLNGGLLEVDGHTKLNSQGNDVDDTYENAGVGSLYVFGNGGKYRAVPDAVPSVVLTSATIIPEYVTPYLDGNRSTWLSKQATVLGDTDTVKGGEATIRINNGAYGETHGLYIGYSEGSRGDVSVMGMGSELHVYKDEENTYKVENIQGSGGLTVSNHALVQLHDDSNITINGASVISHNSLLHLNKNSILDSRESLAVIVNARVEGIGTVTAENGVKFIYDSTYAPEDSLYDPVYKEIVGKLESKVTRSTSAQIDPGLYYGWDNIDEYYNRYGTLTFGDQLTLCGNITTFIDVNSGWPIDGIPGVPEGTAADKTQMNDIIMVKRSGTPTSDADITAQLSGTLKIHARLTNYYSDDPSFRIVQTEGDEKSGKFVPGKIISMFDRLEIVPWRFFESPSQQIVTDEAGNEDLLISMKLKKNPFAEAGQTYNEKSTGGALDSIYALRDTKWLPVLRYFWYLEDAEFLAAYRSLSGEVRAHSLLMPLQNPWIYNRNRYDFRPCPHKEHHHNYDKPEQLDPCEMAELANNVKGCDSLLDRLKKRWDKCKKDVRIWGDFIYEESDYDSDGNANSFEIVRKGGVVGIDKPTCDKKNTLGFQFTFAETELNTYQADAKNTDFNFGIYHTRKIHNVFIWQNYLGMGIQDYKTKRKINSGTADYKWEWIDAPDPDNPAAGYYKYDDSGYNNTLRSQYRGYTFYANTELARPFILGTCKQYMIKPYSSINIIGTWQNSASERGQFTNSEFVKLNFLTASNVRTYGQLGIDLERNGDCFNIHAGLAYQFQLGGRHYTNVNNIFQFGGNQFNIRSVNTGNDFLNLNWGTELYLGKKKNQYIMLNYQALLGKNITSQNIQLGYQYKF